MTLEEFLLKLNELRVALIENLEGIDPYTRDRQDLNPDWVAHLDMIRAIDHVKQLSTQLMGYFIPEEAQVTV